MLVDNSYFALSRNFRLQKIGDINWLMDNYDFGLTATQIDELIILDVSRGGRNIDVFCSIVKSISQKCFIPISAGGGVLTFKHAEKLLHAGADKIVLNTALFEDIEFVRRLGNSYGIQCIVGSIDVKKCPVDSYKIFIKNGTQEVFSSTLDVLELLDSDIIGELYLTSVDKDGTGQGLDLNLYKLFESKVKVPIIFAGGVGNVKHIEEGFKHGNLNAIATANLLNFIGDGLRLTRENLITQKIDLAIWDHLVLSNK
ncbi:HisA/HisF-related TIM barrel protein [Alphaproteobacteria bacterium]|nr:HisA/HisF-related TIM barrel protein [Alphaproteobacteria bacterium]